MNASVRRAFRAPEVAMQVDGDTRAAMQGRAEQCRVLARMWRQRLPKMRSPDEQAWVAAEVRDLEAEADQLDAYWGFSTKLNG